MAVRSARLRTPAPLAAGATALAVVLVALLLFRDGDSYTVTARFATGGQLVEGSPVRSGGVEIGSIKRVDLAANWEAEVTLEIRDARHVPLRQGTRAAIRQFSLSGIANRFVDLSVPSRGGADIPDGGRIGADHTTTQVDVDQLFNTFDPRTRRAMRGVIQGQARALDGRGDEANAGLRYLNPALATTSHLAAELTEDVPVLERFVVDSAELVGALADRRRELAELVGDLERTTGALARRKEALAESIELLPPFLRRANTTLAGTRAALDDIDPLVEAARPLARRLGPALSEARGFAAHAQPATRDLSAAIRRPGPGNDAVDLLRTIPPLEDIAVVSRARTAAPGGRSVPVGSVRGALPELAGALAGATPEIALGRPYTNDFLGWLDDFSTTGGGFDALGAFARAQLNLSEFAPPNPGVPVRQGQFRRCPGSAEAAAADGSNMLGEELSDELQCEEEDRAVGDAR